MLKWRVWFTEKKLAGACIVTGFILFVAIRPKFILWQSSELWISPFSFLGQGTQFFSFSFFFVFIKAVKTRLFFYPASAAYFAVRTMIRRWWLRLMYLWAFYDNWPFPTSPKPLFQSEAKCEAIDMNWFVIVKQIELISKNSFAFSLVLKVRAFLTLKCLFHLIIKCYNP